MYSYTYAAHPDEATQTLQNLVGELINSQPRSRQKRIGPSEIGNPCTHCLAARLAGWEKQETGVPLATTIGTGYHLLMEHLIGSHQETISKTVPSYKPRYLTEAAVTVGNLGDTPISGSTDLLDTWAGMTVDYKVVGDNAFRKYKTKGPSDTYRIQAHLYAKGWNDAGIKVNTVSIWFIPKTALDLAASHWWWEPYTPSIANAALSRLNKLHKQLIEFPSRQEQDAWISTLPRDPTCWDCSKYADKPQDPLFNL